MAIKTGFRQHALDTGDVRRLAAMRGAGERQLLVAKAVAVGRALLDQRQRLQCLDRRARKYRRSHVADGKHVAALRIGHRDGAAVSALHQQRRA